MKIIMTKKDKMIVCENCQANFREAMISEPIENGDFYYCEICGDEI